MTSRTEAFRALHHAGDHAAHRPLLLPNAWDVASARALAAEGFAAIGTTSMGVALAAGIPDGRGLARAATLDLVRRLGGLGSLLTVDIEGGFGDDPGEVADFVVELAEAGAVGVNIEDGREETRLLDAERQAALVAAVKAAVPALFVNARTDTYWLDVNLPDRLGETLRRLRRYADAGADGVFVPNLPDEAHLTAVVEAVDLPLNVLYQPARHTVERLADLGVRRISTGSLLFRTALGATTAAARAFRAGDTPDATGVPAYAEAQRLVTGD